MSISAKFLTAFNPENQEHVTWFKHMIAVAKNFNGTETKIDLVGEIQMNPMKVEFGHSDALEWVHVHFCLAMKYCQAVLDHQAFIPDN
jgi:hypothetical protein